MLLILMLINILLMFAGVSAMINRHVHDLANGIKTITAVSIAFVLISYAFYLSLVFKIDIAILTYIVLAINLLIAGLNIKAYLNVFRFKSSQPSNSKAALFPLLIVFILTGFYSTYTERWGVGDAIIIWDIHAKALYFGKIIFLNSAAPDHPLLLPGLVAMFWKLINKMSPLVPALVVYLPMIFIPLLAYFSLLRDDVRSRWFAWAALIIFTLSTNFALIACAQGADTLVALMVLLTFVLYMHVKPGNEKLLYYTGFAAAASTWAKNEGILFLVVFSFIFLVSNYKKKDHLKNYIIGCIIPIVVLLSFKIFYSPTNDLVGNAGHTGSLVHNMLDCRRYIFIGRFLFSIIYHYYIDIILLLFIALLVNPKYFRSQAFIVMAIIFVAYFMIYTTSPYDLQWHLSTSYNRILQHIYPALVYTILLSFQQLYSEKELAV